MLAIAAGAYRFATRSIADAATQTHAPGDDRDQNSYAEEANGVSENGVHHFNNLFCSRTYLGGGQHATVISILAMFVTD